MREEKDKTQMNENDIFENSEDVLSMLKNMSPQENDQSGKNGVDDDYYTQFDQETDMEDTDDDLLALLDMITAQDENNDTEEEESILYTSEDSDMVNTNNSEDDTHDDIMAINEMIANGSDEFISSGESEKKEEQNSKSGDVADLFSDVLSAVGSLEDEPETELSQDNSRDIFKELEPNIDKTIDKEEKKKGVFQSIFGKKDAKETESEKETKGKKNTNKKNAKKKNKAVPLQSVQTEEEEDRLERERKEAAKKKKEEKKAVAKEKTAKKKAERAQAQKLKAEQKKEKQKLKKAKAEELNKQYAEENPPVKLNRIAVVLVMTFCILLGGIVIIGTNAYSYSLGVKNAEFDFNIKRYTEAYNQIYGLDIRKDDQETYEKIMTVMYVNKQLNSYYNYYQMKEYPEALDSLLKGLERYDKHIEKAAKLGIKEDFEYVKGQITKELTDSFHLTAEEVADLRQKDDQEKYSIKVINTALQKVSK